MEQLTFLIILIYFIIGGIAIALINKKDNVSENKRRWIKYFVYLFIVNAIVLSIIYFGFVFIAPVILIIGFYEIIKVWREASVKNSFKLFFAILLYLVFCFCFIEYSFVKEKYNQLFVYTLVFTFDGFSQITGQLFGRNKFTKISPGKTIEGVVGGLVTSLVTAIFLKEYLFLSITKVVGISLLICLFALTGDLMASYYKRLCNVKDYSNLIPGHGGILDRFDSFIAAGAFYWIITLLK